MEVSEVKQEDLHKKVISKGNNYLSLVGLKLDCRDRYRSFFDRLRLRRFYVVVIFFFTTTDVGGQLIWLISFANGNGDLIDVTFLLPCLAVSLLGFVKSISFIKNVHYIHEIISILKDLKIKMLTVTTKQDDFEKKSVQFLNTADKIIMWVTIVGIVILGLGPLVVVATIYYNTGEIKLFYPFLFSYPFNEYDIRIFPFLYAQQLWSAVATLCMIWGPDYIFYAVATFIIIQYFTLKQHIINLFPKSNRCELIVANHVYRVKFREIVKWHGEILRCAMLLEVTFTKTVLFNVVMSSTLICCNVFNITANDNITIRAPSIAFLAIVLGQIFLLCYFGDTLMTASMEVSDAVYHSQWYKVEPAIVKDLIFMSLRANKPCKLTAYGFYDVNLRTFTKILSTSWSYLALLQTVYDKNKADSKI